MQNLINLHNQPQEYGKPGVIVFAFSVTSLVFWKSIDRRIKILRLAHSPLLQMKTNQ
jgi:hypothetical protein